MWVFSYERGTPAVCACDVDRSWMVWTQVVEEGGTVRVRVFVTEFAKPRGQVVDADVMT